MVVANMHIKKPKNKVDSYLSTTTTKVKIIVMLHKSLKDTLHFIRLHNEYSLVQYPT